MEYLRQRQKPEWLDRPQPGNPFLWQAYHYLTGSRTLNGDIPISEIKAFCEWAGITCPVQRTRVANTVIALNNAERTHVPAASA